MSQTFATKMNGISPEVSDNNTNNATISSNGWKKLNAAPWADDTSKPAQENSKPQTNDKNTSNPSQNTIETNQLAELGIDLSTQCLVEGGCGMDIYKTMDIRKNRTEETSVMNFVQDILLGATYFIGTIVTVALLYSGFLYITSPVESGNKKKAQDGMKYALIGMVVVTLALVIVRLIQFLAKGGA